MKTKVIQTETALIDKQHSISKRKLLDSLNAQLDNYQKQAATGISRLDESKAEKNKIKAELDLKINEIESLKKEVRHLTSANDSLKVE